MEEWRAIPGYDGLYEVSNYGGVRSLNYNHTGTTKQLAFKRHKSGYSFVTLCKDKIHKNSSVHILVALAFVPNPLGKHQVNHKDGDRGNNCFDNLEWVTASENIRHSFNVLGKISPAKGRMGKSHYAAKPVFQYGLNGEFVKGWDCISDAARDIGCKPCQIINNIQGRNKTCHGYMWRFEKHDQIDTSPVTGRKTHKKAGL